MNQIVQGLKSSLNTSHEFYYVFQKSPIVITNLLCELYMHNLVVLDDRDSIPLMYVGDIQIREFMTWGSKMKSQGKSSQAIQGRGNLYFLGLKQGIE